MKRSTMDLWVGLFFTLGIASLLFLALKVGNLSGATLQSPYTLTANFANIGGLKPRGAVKSAGVVVGRVDAIRFDSTTYEATVTLNIDGRYQFPIDTFAAINTSGLLGEQYISLEAGGDDKLLKSGDKLSKTQSAVVLEKLIGQFIYQSKGGGDTAASKP